MFMNTYIGVAQQCACLSSFQGVLIKGFYSLTISHTYTGLIEEDSGAEKGKAGDRGSWLSNRGSYDRMSIINLLRAVGLYRDHNN